MKPAGFGNSGKKRLDKKKRLNFAPSFLIFFKKMKNNRQFQEVFAAN